MSIRKLSRTKKAIAGYEVWFGENTMQEDCKFISEVTQFSDVKITLNCSMGQAKCMVYVDSESVIRMIEKEFGV